MSFLEVCVMTLYLSNNLEEKKRKEKEKKYKY